MSEAWQRLYDLGVAAYQEGILAAPERFRARVEAFVRELGTARQSLQRIRALGVQDPRIDALEKRRGGRIAIRRDPRHDLTGRTVILVDDQVTNGNTMNGCVKALVEAGAEVVRVLTWSSSHETTEPTTSSCWLRRHHLPCDEHDGQTPF